MDGQQFDRLAARLGQRLSRRGAVAVLGGVIAGTAGEAAARPQRQKHRRKKKTCPACKKREQGTCKGKKPNGTACPGGTCRGGRCIATRVPPTPEAPRCGTGGPCLVFVTSTTYNGNLGGLSGADGLCQLRAQAAGLSGTYKAWLSDSTSSPSTRFVKSPGPYRLVDGTLIAANWDDLTTCTPSNPFPICLGNPIDATETGGSIVGYAWTDTRESGNGSARSFHCQNWSSSNSADIGDGGLIYTITNSAWTCCAAASCNEARHLYCFQQS